MSDKNKEETIKVEETEADQKIKEEIHKQSKKILKRLPAMGPILFLYMQSAHRRFHFVSDLEWLLIPPLVSGQCKLYMRQEYPISFVSWAFLDREAEKRLLQNSGKLRQQDWNCGDRLWLIDIIAPFGGVENMLRDLQVNEFPGKEICLAAPDPKTGGITVRKLPPLKGAEEQKEKKGSSGESIH